MTTEKSVVFSAQALSEFGDAPTCAIFRDSAALLADVNRVAKVIAENGLNEARLPADIHWLPESTALDLRMHNAELVVGKSRFWFTDFPKHANYVVETSAMTIEELESAVAAGEPLYFVALHSSEDLKGTYADALAGSEAEEE